MSLRLNAADMWIASDEEFEECKVVFHITMSILGLSYSRPCSQRADVRGSLDEFGHCTLAFGNESKKLERTKLPTALFVINF